MDDHDHDHDHRVFVSPGSALRAASRSNPRPISPRRMEEALPGLIAAHWDPRNASGALAAGPTRASVANAITLYAHDGQDDEDLELALEEAAGLVLARQAPLPWAPAPAARGVRA